MCDSSINLIHALSVQGSILTASATADISMLEDVATDAAEIIPLASQE